MAAVYYTCNTDPKFTPVSVSLMDTEAESKIINPVYRQFLFGLVFIFSKNVHFVPVGCLFVPLIKIKFSKAGFGADCCVVHHAVLDILHTSIRFAPRLSCGNTNFCRIAFF